MYDVIVLGGGPGGYRAAELAGKAGLKTAIIEKDYLGGMCLNRGCIPTKAYYSDIVSSLNPLKDMLTKKDKVISTLRSGVEKLMQLNKVDIINGYGTIKEITTDIKQIEIKTSDNCEIIEGKNLIIATGSKTLDMDFPNNNLPEVLRGDYDINNKDLWDPESDVKSVAIAGAGVIAIEFAVMLKKLGKEVTILKHSDQILRKCDEDIKKRLASNLKRMKIKLLDYFEIKNVEKKENKLMVNGIYKKGDIEVECDRLVLASSMIPIVEGYGLENSGLEYDRKGIKTDEHKRTNIKGVYAIGDVTGGMMLAHVAEYEAMVVIDDLLGKDYTINYNAVPACVFAEPEIATVGITERDAKAEGINIKIGRSYFRGNGMALAMNRSDGFVKVIADENNKLLGTHIMGSEASALIGEAALAIHAGLTADEVAKCVHAHPTLAECFKDALFNLLDN